MDGSDLFSHQFEWMGEIKSQKRMKGSDLIKGAWLMHGGDLIHQKMDGSY